MSFSDHFVYDILMSIVALRRRWRQRAFAKLWTSKKTNDMLTQKGVARRLLEGSLSGEALFEFIQWDKWIRKDIKWTIDEAEVSTIDLKDMISCSEIEGKWEGRGTAAETVESFDTIITNAVEKSWNSTMLKKSGEFDCSTTNHFLVTISPKVTKMNVVHSEFISSRMNRRMVGGFFLPSSYAWKILHRSAAMLSA